MRIERSGIILTIFCIFFVIPLAGFGIDFNDSGTERIILKNDLWEISFLKTNGAIEYIHIFEKDKDISVGSRNANLWYAEFMASSPNYVRGSNYRNDWSNKFSYDWDMKREELVFKYTPDPRTEKKLEVEVTIKPEGDRWLKMKLKATNNWNDYLLHMHFPADISFYTANIKYAVMPYLPGTVLFRSFFTEARSYNSSYPGTPGTFADFILLSIRGGNFTVHGSQNRDTFLPAILGVNHFNAGGEDRYYYRHSYSFGAENGTTFETPWVTLGLGIEEKELALKYREDNLIHEYPGIREKLGPLYKEVSEAPLIKLDVSKINLEFSSYPFNIYSHLPVPSLLHYVSFQRGGFDENNPDWLPPAPQWGSTEDFVATIETAQELGHLVMPYTNVTWWDEESETLRYLPVEWELDDLVVTGINNQQIYETYIDKGGYVMNPFSPFVKNRIEEFFHEFTELVPSDMIFEDQIGARAWLFDINKYSPTLNSYIQGWLDHCQEYQHHILGTEMGFDKLAKYLYGFFGSGLLFQENGLHRTIFGNLNYSFYPMAPMILRDKTMLYQHDLAHDTLTNDNVRFAWNVAYGYLFNQEVQGWDDAQNWWIHVVSEFQKYVTSHYADKRLLSYDVIDRNITLSDFGEWKAVVNWNVNHTFEYDGHVISSSGVYIFNEDKSITAGNYSSYNGFELQHGWQSFIEIKHADHIQLFHPWGDRTDVAIKMLDHWDNNEEIAVTMYDMQDRPLETIRPVVENRMIKWRMDEKYTRSGIKYYIIKKYDPKRKKITY